jgi:hypothetical protein
MIVKHFNSAAHACLLVVGVWWLCKSGYRGGALKCSCITCSECPGVWPPCLPGAFYSSPAQLGNHLETHKENTRAERKLRKKQVGISLVRTSFVIGGLLVENWERQLHTRAKNSVLGNEWAEAS